MFSVQRYEAELRDKVAIIALDRLCGAAVDERRHTPAAAADRRIAVRAFQIADAWMAERRDTNEADL